MSSHSIFRMIRSVQTGLFFIRASARAVVENRSIRGVVELLLVADDMQKRASVESELAHVLQSENLFVAVITAESVEAYFNRERLSFNRIAVSVDALSVIGAESDWDQLPTALDGATGTDLLDYCIRIGETGDLASIGELNEVHPSAARVMSLPRRDSMLRLTQLLVSRHVVEGLRLLDAFGLMQILLPEISGLKGFHLTSPHHHKDVYEHTLQVVSQAVPTPLVRWSALLHDIGKLHTRSFTPDGQVHFFKHDEVGAYLSDGVMARLSFPQELSMGIHTLVLLHLRPGLYTPAWSDAAIRRLMKEAGTVLNALFDLARADNTTKRMSKRRANLRNVKALSDRCRAVALDAERPQVKLPRGLGNAIKLQFELEPGPRIGELCALCSQGVLDGRLAKDATVEHHLAFLKNTPDLMNRLPGAASSLSN